MRHVLLILLVAGNGAGMAQAQPVNLTVDTVDWMAVDSPVIVRAVVSDFVHQRDDAAAKEWSAVVLRVRETLKGPHKPFHTVAMEVYPRVSREGPINSDPPAL
jgi:hypothetical protein